METSIVWQLWMLSLAVGPLAFQQCVYSRETGDHDCDGMADCGVVSCPDDEVRESYIDFIFILIL